MRAVSGRPKGTRGSNQPSACLLTGPWSKLGNQRRHKARGMSNEIRRGGISGSRKNERGGPHSPPDINIGTSGGDNSPSIHSTSHSLTSTQHHPNPLNSLTFKMFTYGSNFSGANFGHPVAENNNTDHNGYPFGAPSGNSESVTRVDQAGNLDLDTTIVSPSTAAAENWWLGLSLNGGSSQYPESTVLEIGRAHV